jgi:hypothetical protein
MAVSRHINVLDFGARGDGRTDDGAAINRALSAARDLDGAELHFPPRPYLVGGTPSLLATALVLEGASNVSLTGAGATLLQGPHGLRTLGIFACDRVRVRGLRFIGSAAQAGRPYYQHSSAIAVAYGSREISIEDCRVANYLGDCLYLGGTLTDGGGLGAEVRAVSVRRCVLQERYGDGRRIHDGGSRSRVAIAVIDAVGVLIRQNVIYGVIDLEPNLDGQHLVDCTVEDNRFLAGPVVPLAGLRRGQYHAVEAVTGAATRGAVPIEGGVRFTGIPGRPVVRNNVVRGNELELGTVSVQNPYVARIENNVFRRGGIRVGDRSGANYTAGVTIERNRTERVLAGRSSFITLAGRVAASEFLDNAVDDAGAAVIGDDGPGSGDLGRSVFRHNVNTGRIGHGDAIALALAPAPTSHVQTGDTPR